MVRDLDGFWAAVTRFFEVDLVGAAGRVLAGRAMPGATWLPGAQVNCAEYALRAGDSPAIIAVGEDDPGHTWSRDQLRRHVAGFAAYLRAAGIGPGDRVVGYLPNVIEAVVAFLALASVGATWSLCGPELGTTSVVSRFAQLEPAVLIASDSYVYGGKRHDRRQVIADLRAALLTPVQADTQPPRPVNLAEHGSTRSRYSADSSTSTTSLHNCPQETQIGFPSPTGQAKRFRRGHLLLRRQQAGRTARSSGCLIQTRAVTGWNQ